MSSTAWVSRPIWSLASETREVVDPASLGEQVVHYSIPTVDATGAGQIEATETIKSAKLRLRGGEVLISKLNPRKSRVLVVSDSPLPVVSSTEFVALRVHDALESRYLVYALQSELTRQALDSQVQSVTRSHQRVAPEDITHLSVLLPGLKEQGRIADWLDAETARLGALASARVSQLHCLEQLWDARLADKAGELIMTYGLVPMRRVVNLVEQGWSPQCDDVEADPSEWAVLKTSAVSSGEFAPSEHKRLPVGVEADLRYQIKDGDVLLTRGSGSPSHVGVPVVARVGDRKLLLSDLLYRVRLDPGWSPAFVTLMLRSRPIRGFMSLLFRGQSGQTIKLRSEDVRSIDIPAVPFPRQKQFAEELEIARRSIREAQERIRRSGTLLAERRQALITAAVTGQFDVSTASGRNVTEGITA